MFYFQVNIKFIELFYF